MLNPCHLTPVIQQKTKEELVRKTEKQKIERLRMYIKKEKRNALKKKCACTVGVDVSRKRGKNKKAEQTQQGIQPHVFVFLKEKEKRLRVLVLMEKVGFNTFLFLSPCLLIPVIQKKNLMEP